METLELHFQLQVPFLIDDLSRAGSLVFIPSRPERESHFQRQWPSPFNLFKMRMVNYNIFYSLFLFSLNYLKLLLFFIFGKNFQTSCFKDVSSRKANHMEESFNALNAN